MWKMKFGLENNPDLANFSFSEREAVCLVGENMKMLI